MKRGPYYAEWEWLIPASLIVLLAKPLLDGFLQELGAEGARTLKSALKKVFQKTREQNPRLLSTGDLELLANPEAKIDSSKLGRPTPVVALEFRFEAEGYSRFVFPYELDELDLERALNSLPDALTKVAEIIQRRLELKRPQPL